MTLWSVFWRSFAQMFGPFVLAAMAVDWTTEYEAGGKQLVIGLVVSVVAALAAVAWSASRGPAATAFDKAVRSFFEKLGVGLGAVVVNEIADIISLPRLLIPVLVSSVLASAVTYFSYQGPPPEAPPAPA